MTIHFRDSICTFGFTQTLLRLSTLYTEAFVIHNIPAIVYGHIQSL